MDGVVERCVRRDSHQLTQYDQRTGGWIDRADRALDVVIERDGVRDPTGAVAVYRALHEDDIAHGKIVLRADLAIDCKRGIVGLESDAVYDDAAERGDGAERARA